MNDIKLLGLWRRFQEYYTVFPELGLAVDISRMNFSEEFLKAKQPELKKAFAAMARLETGAIANRDEKRMVGHYWLRNPALAPKPGLRKEINTAIAAVKGFTAQVHSGQVKGAKGTFKYLLLIGIGGSALGPEFAASALGQPGTDKLTPFFFDNTDPDGMARVLAQIGRNLGQTLTVVVSKSGGTKETRNGMLEAAAAYEKAGLNFAAHAVAVTGIGSQLDNVAKDEGWLRRFPMWDWVGGRTSELSAVGLLPAALQGLDIDALLAGARACDAVTRKRDFNANPAAQLALMWYYIGNGKGAKNMVILPYKDRLGLLSKYLQQLIMESLGKKLDIKGNPVYQGITVLGNKGSTDQHSYVQQLRDGLNNCFVTFIEVLRDQSKPSLEVEPGVTSGDYLSGFFLGTRTALYESDRESVTLTINEVSAFSVGVLIALFERTVGLYASLIHVNAYHQPGVEAGKKAAEKVLELQGKVFALLKTCPGGATAEEIAAGLGQPQDAEMVFKICCHLAANPDRGVQSVAGTTPYTAQFKLAS